MRGILGMFLNLGLHGCSPRSTMQITNSDRDFTKTSWNYECHTYPLLPFLILRKRITEQISEIQRFTVDLTDIWRMVSPLLRRLVVGL
jgi:hypothetical protein